MRNAVLAACLALTSIHVGAAGSELDAKVWNHGSADCSSNRDPPIEVFRFDASTYILRQNKCLNFEAPFVYVLIGERQVFVQDTGATDDPANVEGIARFVAPMKNVEWVEVQPFHQMGEFKWKAMGLDYKHLDTQPASRDLVNRVIEQFRAAGCQAR